jgi:hypothetical protein
MRLKAQGIRLEKSAMPSLLKRLYKLMGRVRRSFLRFRVSRPGLFYDLSAGEFYPLRIPLAPSTGSVLGAAVSPTDKS